jgi:hypothetical protein
MAAYLANLLGWRSYNKRLRDEADGDDDEVSLRASLAKARPAQVADAILALRTRARAAEARVSELEIALTSAGGAVVVTASPPGAASPGAYKRFVKTTITEPNTESESDLSDGVTAITSSSDSSSADETMRLAFWHLSDSAFRSMQDELEAERDALWQVISMLFMFAS